MKDPVFAGKDVAEAVRLASRTLAMPEAALRYVVLDKGQAGGRGLSPTDAKIAVLLDHLAGEGSGASAREDAAGPTEVDWEHGRRGGRRAGRRTGEEPRATGEDAESAVRGVVEELARAAGVELSVTVMDGREAVEVQLDGPGAKLFFEERGETVAALEHVVERLYGRALGGRRVRLRCAGYREYRDEVLRERALELAREVRADGQSRTTSALNAYERRVIHVALEGEAGVMTFSVGEGAGRRVTVAARSEEPRTAEASAAAVSGAGVSVARDAGVGQEAPVFDARRFDRPPEGGGASELM